HGDSQVLRFAETASKAEARWLNVDAESRRNHVPGCRPTCGRRERVAYCACKCAVRCALHAAHGRDVQGLGIAASVGIRVEEMLRGLIHHQTGESRLAQINSPGANVVGVPRSCSILL